VVHIPAAEQAERAFNLGLAAILGKGVYNFGELVGAAFLYPSFDSFSPLLS
jgi:26S proteasome regulatory subunit N9